MIQRRAEVTAPRASGGTPIGPTAKETSVKAVAAKKKTDASAIRRRSSWAASLEATAHARERLPLDRFSPSPTLPLSPSAPEWGRGRGGEGGTRSDVIVLTQPPAPARRSRVHRWTRARRLPSGAAARSRPGRSG